MKKILIFISLFLVILTSACTNKKMYKETFMYMDTYIEIKVYGINKKKSEEVLSTAKNMYKEYHELTDRYNSYEDIINVHYINNELKVNEEVEIDSRLADLINFGLKAYEDTDGYINIAMGNVIDVWKTYREEGKKVPKTYELMNQNINIKNISLDGNKFIKKGKIKLDLGAFVKGYVTEEVGKYFESKGVTKYLINAGGNVKVGESYKIGKYNVGLETPFNTSNIYKTLSVENVSIVTSGSYQRYYEVDNKIYNHIINPKTLYPENFMKSVTVVTSNSAYADILSTYLFLIPIEDGLKLVNSLDGVEAIWNNDAIYYSRDFNIYEQV